MERNVPQVSDEIGSVTVRQEERLAAGPTVAIGLAKHATHSAQHATLTEAMAHETFGIELSCRTVDFKSLAALTQRRTPEFGGR
jgi:2-(1,2-epoxy-1,2-dihydrophenyl)acetyl-CoA isomerase